MVLVTNRLGSGLREEVGGEESASDALVKLGITVVGGIQESILEATWVLKAQVDLAVLGVVGNTGARPDVGLERVEAKGDNLSGVSFSLLSSARRSCRALTVASGDMVVETVPWGQPLPEVEELKMVMLPEGAVERWRLSGLAAARRGSRK
jgi:hypothetical protein